MKLSSSALILLLLASTGSMAAEPGDRPTSMTPPLQQYDLNQDGRLTRDELQRALEMRFKKADLDHNGALSATEYEKVWRREMPMSAMQVPPPQAGLSSSDAQPLPPQGAVRSLSGPPPLNVAFARADSDGDGRINFEEFAAPARQIFTDFDVEHRGEITLEQLRSFQPPAGAR